MKTNPKTQADGNSSENQSPKKSFKRVSEYGKQLQEKQTELTTYLPYPLQNIDGTPVA